MKYYKLLTNEEFIGVATSNDFVSENPVTKWLLTSDEISGQFIQYNNQLYRDYWMKGINHSTRAFTNVQIMEISKADYDMLNNAILNNEPILADEGEEPILSPVPVNYEEGLTIDFLRQSKVNEMSATCRGTIEAGFDFGALHFSLDTQDQLNLITLSALAETQELIPYHADGELCRFYTADEMKQIVAAATQFKMYHTTYYNALKNYINNLDTIEDIAAVTYGMELPEEYQSDVLKAIT